jgi:hypothetical protein
VRADVPQAVSRHHGTLGQVPLAGPVERVVGEIEAVAAADRVEQSLCRGQYLGADAVTGNEGDAVAGHELQ